MNNSHKVPTDVDSDSHIFAFYFNQTTKLTSQKNIGGVWQLDDNVLIHRMAHILRLQEGQEFILFDQQHSMTCQLESLNQRSVQYKIMTISCNIKHQPEITVLLPLLKREALQEALYAAVELGAAMCSLLRQKKDNIHGVVQKSLND